MLSKAVWGDKTVLEVGCNIGRNLDQLSLSGIRLVPSAIEINRDALEFAKSKHTLSYDWCGPVQEAQLPSSSFELVFTSGVLIHIPPNDLISVMSKMYTWSSKYILIAEYFSREPVSIEYQGRSDTLFKRDFGSVFMDSFSCKIIDYGFLWGRIYDVAGFDDVTWWLFEKC